MKIQMNDDQLVLYYKFLQEAYRITPISVSQKENKVQLQLVKKHFSSIAFDNTLSLSQKAFESTFQLFPVVIMKIKDEQLGERLFNDLRELFILFHQRSESAYPVSSFIDTDYRKNVSAKGIFNYSDFIRDIESDDPDR